ncbi:50S ribosomal protein L35 [Candidatus Saccharibacteria bacterium]|nr:50S ribosomal protein L35 [Candidatus Saccharibacteria bacterium]
MPKMKTHKGTAKRIKISAGGKLMRRRASGNHLLQKKSAARKRTIGRSAVITGSIAANLKRALGVKGGKARATKSAGTAAKGAN